MTNGNNPKPPRNPRTGLRWPSIHAFTDYALDNNVLPANIKREHLHGSVNTENVHAHTTYVLRSSMLITEDRSRAVDVLSTGGGAVLTG
jgi:hypothetical protein